MNNRNTIQRQLVLETVRSMHSHPDADQIYSAIVKDHPHVSKATVYRNLNLLAEQGQIKKVNVSEGADRFDFRTDKHHHMRCRECGRLWDAPDGAANITLTGNTGGFSVEDIRIELVGTCPDCKRNKNSEV
ncbi:MAG TPA: transcriptional repressor [Candidatus Borkfalkia avistercoris]|uniref:Transcriptional repressor n=1 Tax=Candidatus Borkfalkia avistercoris TaxID=2838504 RepID=A0A9D2A7D2_9FIRM|nr:transcriptional repressor [Candidatus Borkfalkia avistercoris]